MWQEIKILSKEETREFNAKFIQKARFLVDENLGFEVCRILREFSWNVKYTSEVNLSGKSDQDVYKYAHKHGRIILTHDQDYLSDSVFPFYCNPGVIVLPGGDGTESVLVRAISDMLFMIAPFGEVYSGAKIIFYADREIKIRLPRKKGVIIENRYKFIGKKLYQYINN